MPATIDDVLDYAFAIGGIPPGCEIFKVPPVTFVENFMFDPERNERITLHTEQKRVINQMASGWETGYLDYDMWVYSAIKKHGKTSVCAGLLLWQGWRVDRGYIPIIGNDLKQADSRMFRVIEYAANNDPDLKRFCKVNRYRIELANGTIIEAIPVDPTGEAGLNPTAIAYTEAWGMKNKKHREMWSEMALSPTRPGEGFILMESYAGHEGESVILEERHEYGVTHGVEIDEELYEHNKQITYWCTRRIMPWQQGKAADEYYASEAAKLTENEFRRLHKNEWTSSVSVFVVSELWDACLYTEDGKAAPLPAPETSESIVIGLDAGVTNDCFAAVGVSRRGEIVCKRYCRVWRPEPNKPLDFDIIEKELYNDLRNMNVIWVVYDKHQLHHMAGRLAKQLGIYFEVFEQGTRRAVADNDLRLMIHQKLIQHDGDTVLREHVLNANAKTENEKLRIVKRSEMKKIDAAVALSMAVEKAKFLLIG